MFWSENSVVGRSSDGVPGGGGFDSRRAQVTFSGPHGKALLCIFTYVVDGFGTFLGLDRDLG